MTAPAPLRVLLVDDEPLAHDVLLAYTARVAHLQVVGQCYTALEALSFLHQHPVDVLFLDIDMPEMTGLELLQTLPHRPHVILTTAYSEFALTGYEYGVLDYLLKPVPFPRFLKAISRLPASAASPVVPPPAPEPTPAFVLLKDGSTTHRVAVADVQVLEAYGNYVKVHTATGRLVVTSTLRDLLHQFPSSALLRVHKSFAVALAQVQQLEGNVLTVAGHSVPLGTVYRQDFLRHWQPAS